MATAGATIQATEAAAELRYRRETRNAPTEKAETEHRARKEVTKTGTPQTATAEPTVAAMGVTASSETEQWHRTTVAEQSWCTED